MGCAADPKVVHRGRAATRHREDVVELQEPARGAALAGRADEGALLWAAAHYAQQAGGLGRLLGISLALLHITGSQRESSHASRAGSRFHRGGRDALAVPSTCSRAFRLVSTFACA